LTFTDFTGGDDSCISGFCRLLGLVNHFDGRVGGSAGLVESQGNQTDTNERDDDRSERCPKHSFCPESHILLGFQIGYFTLLLPLTCLLVFIGYKIAYRAFYALYCGRVVYGLLLSSSAILIACGSAFLLPMFGYWLAFEGGIWRLL
jgi:hypothetical protein